MLSCVQLELWQASGVESRCVVLCKGTALWLTLPQTSQGNSSLFIRNGAWAKGEVQLFAAGVERAVSRPVRRTWFQNEIRACAVSASIRWNNCLQDIVEGMVRALINFECSSHLEAQENKSLGPCFEKTKTTRHCQHFQPRAPGPLCSADVLPPTLSSQENT